MAERSPAGPSAPFSSSSVSCASSIDPTTTSLPPPSSSVAAGGSGGAGAATLPISELFAKFDPADWVEKKETILVNGVPKQVIAARHSVRELSATMDAIGISSSSSKSGGQNPLPPIPSSKPLSSSSAAEGRFPLPPPVSILDPSSASLSSSTTSTTKGDKLIINVGTAGGGGVFTSQPDSARGSPLRLLTPLQRFQRAAWRVVLLLGIQKRIGEYYLETDVSDEAMEQVGGHASAFVKLKKGRLAKLGDKREIRIYPLLREHFPKEFIPRYWKTYHDDKANCERIVLEDLTFGYEKPCIMDVKMGTRTYEKKAPWLKKLKQTTKDHRSSSRHLGIRLVGLKVWRECVGSYAKVTKKEAKTVNEPADFFGWFLHNGKAMNCHIVGAFLQQINAMIEHFKRQKRFNFVGSSLLFIYDGKNPEHDPKVRMIDFAHTTFLDDEASQAIDEGYLLGLETIRNALYPLYASERAFLNPLPLEPKKHLFGYFRHMDSCFQIAPKAGALKPGMRLILSGDEPSDRALFEWVPFVGKVKRLMSSSSSSEHATIMRSGWLEKQAKIGQGFKKRFFVLRSGTLSYYKMECSAMPVARVSMRGAVVTDTKRERVGRFAFRLSFADGRRKMILAAETEKEKENWKKLLQTAASTASGGSAMVVVGGGHYSGMGFNAAAAGGAVGGAAAGGGGSATGGVLTTRRSISGGNSNSSINGGGSNNGNFNNGTSGNISSNSSAHGAFFTQEEDIGGEGSVILSVAADDVDDLSASPSPQPESIQGLSSRSGSLELPIQISVGRSPELLYMDGISCHGNNSNNITYNNSNSSSSSTNNVVRNAQLAAPAPAPAPASTAAIFATGSVENSAGSATSNNSGNTNNSSGSGTAVPPNVRSSPLKAMAGGAGGAGFPNPVLSGNVEISGNNTPLTTTGAAAGNNNSNNNNVPSRNSWDGNNSTPVVEGRRSTDSTSSGTSKHFYKKDKEESHGPLAAAAAAVVGVLKRHSVDKDTFHRHHNSTTSSNSEKDRDNSSATTAPIGGGSGSTRSSYDGHSLSRAPSLATKIHPDGQVEASGSNSGPPPGMLVVVPNLNPTKPGGASSTTPCSSRHQSPCATPIPNPPSRTPSLSSLFVAVGGGGGGGGSEASSLATSKDNNNNNNNSNSSNTGSGFKSLSAKLGFLSSGTPPPPPAPAHTPTTSSTETSPNVIVKVPATSIITPTPHHSSSSSAVIPNTPSLHTEQSTAFPSVGLRKSGDQTTGFAAVSSSSSNNAVSAPSASSSSSSRLPSSLEAHLSLLAIPPVGSAPPPAVRTPSASSATGHGGNIKRKYKSLASGEVKMLGCIRHVKSGLFVQPITSTWEVLSGKHLALTDCTESPDIVFEMVTGNAGGGWGRPGQLCGHIEHVASGGLWYPENGSGGKDVHLVLNNQEGRGESRVVFQFGIVHL